MKKKLALALSMVMILSLALTGCGNNDKGSNTSSTSGGSNTSASTSTPNNETPSGEKVDITIATGSTSANYYAIGNVMATVLNPVLTKGNIGVTSTGASAANVQLLQDNEVNFAIIQNDVAYYAATGTDLFDGEDGVLSFADPHIRLTTYTNVGIPLQASLAMRSVNSRSGATESVAADRKRGVPCVGMLIRLFIILFIISFGFP